MATSILAVQHLRRMRGGSQSHLLRASDGGYYVTKFTNNPQHVRVLANEMFATRLGQWLGLPMPRVEIIDVSDWLISHTQELRIEIAGTVTSCSSGRQLASYYACNSFEGAIFDYLPEKLLEQVANLGDFARSLVLDKWTCNSDGRQAVFTCETMRCRRHTATLIDQGYCFNAGEWNFPDAALRGTYAHSCVYKHVTNWEAFEPALTRAERMDINDIWRCASEIPEEWYEGDHGGLNRLVEALYKRRANIRDLITAFRRSLRNPFPNWTDD